MIRVLIAEDQALVLGAFARSLDLEADIEVVASATDGCEALRLVQEYQPDLLISDIEMPGLNGLELARKVRAQTPQVRILLVTTFGLPGYFNRALDESVDGFLLKDVPMDQFLTAVREIIAGNTFFDSGLSKPDPWASPAPHLSLREREVLILAELGKSNKQIARDLGISPGTARNYLADAAAKLGALNRVEASRKARQLGWL